MGDNASFIRMWYEISNKRSKWFNCMKGGEYRRWYGNILYLLDWEDNGKRVKNTGRATIRSEQLLRYNPWGLLLFYEKATKKEPGAHIDTVFEILNAIKQFEPDKDRKPEMDTYLLHELVEHIDSCLPYTDEWGKICEELNEIGYIDGRSDASKNIVFIIQNYWLTELRRIMQSISDCPPALPCLTALTISQIS